MALEIDRASREPQLSPLARTAPSAPPVQGVREVPRPADEPAPAFVEAGDASGVTSALQPLVEWLVSDAAPTPARVGIIGGAGSGKSFALKRTMEAIADLGARAPGAGVTRPREILVASLDAAGLAGDAGFDPASALASAVFVALESGRDGANYSALADEAAHGAGDPRRAAVAASERQDELSRRLDSERAQREELTAKRAKLGEALIYDTPGSRVDAMIRSSRSAIDSRLRRFGYAGDDMGQTFRDLLYDHAGAGAGSKVGLFLRSTWAFKGQLSLLLLAVVALLAAFGVERLKIANEQGLIASVAPGVQPVADFINTHGEWLKRGENALIGIAVLAVFFNLWRATGFAALLIRGLRLLNIDLRERRAELDQSVARIERRIASLTSEAQAAAERADQLLKRAGGAAPVHRGPGPGFLQALQTPAKASRDFFAELGRLMATPGESPRPKRIVIGVDNLETLPADRALRLIDAIGALLGPGMAAIVAFDPARFPAAMGRAVARERFDVLFNLDAFAAASASRVALRLISDAGRSAGPAPSAGARNLFDPFGASEAAVLTAVAPLVGGEPGSIRRLALAYRFARTGEAARPLVAVMAAALLGAAREPVEAIEAAISGSGERFELLEPAALGEAFEAARGASDAKIDKAAARAAWAAARLWGPPTG